MYEIEGFSEKSNLSEANKNAASHIKISETAISKIN
jgi:hypothetical protein